MISSPSKRGSVSIGLSTTIALLTATAGGVSSYYAALRQVDRDANAAREAVRLEVAQTYATKEETRFMQDMLKEIKADVKYLVQEKQAGGLAKR